MVDQDGMKSTRTNEELHNTVCDERESSFARVRRMITDSLTSKSDIPTTYDEAKTKCKARKRKERQESISSISQERKVIRSNSEERPIPNNAHDNKNDIRRVVSHEDFQKTRQNIKNLESNAALPNSPSENRSHRQSPQRNIYVEVLGYDDCEHERRRSHERFARPLAQRGRRANLGRKCKAKHFSKAHANKDGMEICKENLICNNAQEAKIIDFNNQDQVQNEQITTSTSLSLDNLLENRSPSPVNSSLSPVLDLSTLHQQIDCSEPMLSSSSQQITEEIETLPSLSVASNRMLSSPRNSIMITHRIYLDPNVPQNNSLLEKESRNPLEHRTKQLSKQINNLKKKIKKFDEEFQSQFGYKPSHADKTNDKSIKKLSAELNKLKKEYKQLKDDTDCMFVTNLAKNSMCESENFEKKLQDTVAEIEKRLNEKRSTSNRGIVIEEMSNEEITDEKVSVQKALLYLESMHGRPSNKEDRDLVRPLYDRYRALKRMMAKFTLSSGTSNELATIHEYETMDFVSSPPQTTDNETEKVIPSGSTDSDTDISIGENLHTLTLDELLQQQKDANEEKKNLRRSLKEFESDFQLKTGRKLQRDDKIPMINVYSSYKQAKSKLRLLDALVGKQFT